MILCLSCRHASPSGSVYCGHCARSFNARLCSGNHRNTLSAQVCTACASHQLTEACIGLPLGWISRGLVLLGLVYGWKWLAAHLCLAERTVWSGFCTITAFLFNTRPACVEGFFTEIFAWIIVMTIFGHFLRFLPGAGGGTGKWLRSLPSQAGRTLWRGGIKVGAALICWVRRLV